jgi:Protein of unknown function (DUF1549)/Protein of unknown function (DUF1553)/Planctomycete cytochrome C
MGRRAIIGWKSCAIVLAVSLSVALADEREELFEEKIRPVLLDKCIGCHGETKASSSLRLDSLTEILEGGKKGPAIVPGNSSESLMVKAIQRQSGVSAMPPGRDKALRPDQVADFAAWIDAGANWPAHTSTLQTAEHWSFEPLRDVRPPSVNDTEWVKTSIDTFILARQEAAGIRPAPIADKLTLIRRATFDLTGLPPKPEEIDAFVQDSSAGAFQALVDRLLQSPAYGERWGRHWLDVVRYADTAGETADYPIPMAWRYRNYVIDAFNADKPYDAFLREQIAGDIMASQGESEHYAEQITATGFLAISRRFGFDSENYQHLTIQDTIDTLGQTVLGLSIGCARCHDHKFDAISMHDYYALYGIFESSNYAFPGSEQKQQVRLLAPLVPPEKSRPIWREFQTRVAASSTWLAKQNRSASTALLRSLHEMDGDFEFQAAAAGGSNGVLVAPWLWSGAISVTNAAQSPYKNCYYSGKSGVSIPAKAGPYKIAQALYPPRTLDNSRLVYVNLDVRIGASETNGDSLHRFFLGEFGGTAAVEVYFSSDGIQLKVDGQSEKICSLEPNQWHNVQLVLDLQSRTVSGRAGQPGATQEFTGKPFLPSSSGTIDYIVLDSNEPSNASIPAIEYDNLAVQDVAIPPVSNDLPSMAVIDSHGHIDGVRPALNADNFVIRETELQPLDAPPVPADEISRQSRCARIEKIRQLLESRQSEAENEEKELQALLSQGPFEMAYGMAEGTPRNARLQVRGEPNALGEEVPRGLLKALGGGPLPASTQGSGRRELAEWLTHSENPLTARVMANRIWQYHFGEGLVKTPNDFGVRGLPPTHPELLDHLAIRFIRSGWSVKAMHRLIMLSATYQQGSNVDAVQEPSVPTAAVADLYQFFRRLRLSAEEIRDSILAVSGELDQTPAREHPFPSPTRWSFTQHNPFFAVYDHNQRSIYLMSQRLKRHPFLSLFDGADPNATTAQRLGTTVPTQALFFLNDPFIHTKSERWASRLVAQNLDVNQCVLQAWRSATGRLPTEVELTEAIDFLAAYRAILIAKNASHVEVQSLAAYLRVLFGSNEFLYVD